MVSSVNSSTTPPAATTQPSGVMSSVTTAGAQDPLSPVPGSQTPNSSLPAFPPNQRSDAGSTAPSKLTPISAIVTGGHPYNSIHASSTATKPPSTPYRRDRS